MPTTSSGTTDSSVHREKPNNNPVVQSSPRVFNCLRISRYGVNLHGNMIPAEINLWQHNYRAERATKEAIERMRRIYLEDNAHEELKENLEEPIPGPPLVGSYETLGPLRTPPRFYYYPDDAVTGVHHLSKK